MTPERWTRIKSLFHEAREQDPGGRADFVARAAGDDANLAQEVLALLAEDARPGGALPHPDERRFVIEKELGRGGMGRVVAAQDVKLGRRVAIKFLSADVADPQALRRFEIEARAAGALSHPNVLVVHDVTELDGQRCIVTELLEGRTLRQMIDEGPIAPKRAVELATQLADGLSAAHAKGVVHRDLKPANIFVTSGGQAKILDFGIAKLLESQEFQTTPGAVMGTPLYMSPEQVKGEPADARSDVFAFGVVVYEMLTGVAPFKRAIPAATMHAILEDEPPPLPPSPLGDVARRCLQKDPAARYADGGDLLAALRGAPVPLARRRRSWPYIVAAGGIAAIAIAVATRQASAPVDRSSIAVLPFVNLSAEKDNDYFSDGVTEELINALANVDGLRVASRTAAFAFKGRNLSVAKIGEELKVASVLEGSIRREGDNLRITAQLIDAGSGYHLWSKTYDREMKGVFAVEDEVARAIAESLRPRLVRDTLVKPSTMSSEAHDLYLRGRYFWNQRSPEGMQKAVAAFQKAIDLDPNYALAYAGLADCYALTKRWPVRPLELLEKAKPLAMKALALDDSLAEAHATLGLIHQKFYDWSAADRELKRAIELKPSYATAHHWYTLMLFTEGRSDEARQEVQRARELEPTNATISRIVGGVERMSGNPGRAIELFKKALELDPTHSETLGEMAMAYAETGQYAQALATFDKVTEDLPYLGGRAYALAMSGDRAGAMRVLAQMEQRSKREYVFPQTFAYPYIAFGDKDRAFEWLERSYADHDLMYLKCMPIFESLRSDPRYHSLLRRMNLE